MKTANPTQKAAKHHNSSPSSVQANKRQCAQIGIGLEHTELQHDKQVLVRGGIVNQDFQNQIYESIWVDELFLLISDPTPELDQGKDIPARNVSSAGSSTTGINPGASCNLECPIRRISNDPINIDSMNVPPPIPFLRSRSRETHSFPGI
jgi:hypothetical protein